MPVINKSFCYLLSVVVRCQEYSRMSYQSDHMAWQQRVGHEMNVHRRQVYPFRSFGFAAESSSHCFSQNCLIELCFFWIFFVGILATERVMACTTLE